MKAQDIDSELIDIVTRVVQAPGQTITLDTNLTQIGVSSVDLIRLVVAVEKRYGIEIQQEEATGITCVRDLAAFLRQKTAELRQEAT